MPHVPYHKTLYPLLSLHSCCPVLVVHGVVSSTCVAGWVWCSSSFMKRSPPRSRTRNMFWNAANGCTPGLHELPASIWHGLRVQHIACVHTAWCDLWHVRSVRVMCVVCAMCGMQNMQHMQHVVYTMHSVCVTFIQFRCLRGMIIGSMAI